MYRYAKRNTDDKINQSFIAKLIVIACVVLWHPAFAADTREAEEPETMDSELAEAKRTGVLASLSFLIQWPKKVGWRDPDLPTPPDGDVEYNRRFPIGAEAALRRGC